MRVSKHLLGSICAVTFEDHSMGTTPGEVVNCLVYGEVFKITPTKLIIRYWQCIGDEPGGNDEFVNIVKPAIKSIAVLKEKEKGITNAQ